MAGELSLATGIQGQIVEAHVYFGSTRWNGSAMVATLTITDLTWDDSITSLVELSSGGTPAGAGIYVGDMPNTGQVGIHHIVYFIDGTDTLGRRHYAIQAFDNSQLSKSKWTDAKAEFIDAAITSRLAPTVALRTLDVSAGGEAGLDWANIGSKTTTVGLTNTTIGIVTTNTDLVTAASIVTAMELDGSKLDHIWETTEDDGGTRRFTALALALSPAATTTPTTIWAFASRTLSGTALGLGPTAVASNTDGIYTVPTGGTVGLYKRLKIWDGTDAQQADITSITYSIFALDEDNEDTRGTVTGHEDVSIVVADVIYNTIQSDEAATNYNFAHIPLISSNAAFGDTGTIYLVEYKLTPVVGELIIERFKVTAV